MRPYPTIKASKKQLMSGKHGNLTPRSATRNPPRDATLRRTQCDDWDVQDTIRSGTSQPFGTIFVDQITYTAQSNVLERSCKDLELQLSVEYFFFLWGMSRSSASFQYPPTGFGDHDRWKKKVLVLEGFLSPPVFQSWFRKNRSQWVKNHHTFRAWAAQETENSHRERGAQKEEFPTSLAVCKALRSLDHTPPTVKLSHKESSSIPHSGHFEARFGVCLDLQGNSFGAL